MKTIRVVAAVICDSIEHKTKIFSTARGYGEFKGGWEFPGGKIEDGETPQQAVDREIREELDATVKVGDLIDTIEYDYPAFHLSMDCFWCEVVSGELIVTEDDALTVAVVQLTVTESGTVIDPFCWSKTISVPAIVTVSVCAARS